MFQKLFTNLQWINLPTFLKRAKIQTATGFWIKLIFLLFSLRRSARQRKKPKELQEQETSEPTKKRSNKTNTNPGSSIRTSHQSRLIPTINSLVSTDARNLQLVTPIFDENLSVMNYLKHCLEASIVTSNAIDEASASGIDFCLLCLYLFTFVTIFVA